MSDVIAIFSFSLFIRTTILRVQEESNFTRLVTGIQSFAYAFDSTTDSLRDQLNIFLTVFNSRTTKQVGRALVY